MHLGFFIGQSGLTCLYNFWMAPDWSLFLKTLLKLHFKNIQTITPQKKETKLVLVSLQTAVIKL